MLEASTSAKRYGRQLSEKNWSLGEREVTEWIATVVGHEPRKISRCAIEDSGPSGFGSSFLVAGLRYRSNAMSGRYGCLLD